MRIKFILLALLLTPSIYSQDIDYMKMIEMEMGSSLDDVKTIWETGELKEYGYLKGEQILAREKNSFLVSRDKSDDFIFSCYYNFIEDSLFSTILTTKLTLNEANRLANLIQSRFGESIKDDSWKIKSFDVMRNNKKDGSTNVISFGVEPRGEKIKISISVTNLKLVEKRDAILDEFFTQNNSLNGFFNIIWESSKEEVIESMKSFEGVRVDSIREYRVDFSGGEFGGVKVSKWIYAFEDDKFYNLLIEFDSKAGSNDFDRVKELLTFHYGNEFNSFTTHSDIRYGYLIAIVWPFYDKDEKIYATINLKGCCDVERPKPLRLSYTYVSISRNVLPKRPSQINRIMIK